MPNEGELPEPEVHVGVVGFEQNKYVFDIGDQARSAFSGLGVYLRSYRSDTYDLGADYSFDGPMPTGLVVARSAATRDALVPVLRSGLPETAEQLRGEDSPSDEVSRLSAKLEETGLYYGEPASPFVVLFGKGPNHESFAPSSGLSGEQKVLKGALLFMLPLLTKVSSHESQTLANVDENLAEYLGAVREARR